VRAMLINQPGLVPDPPRQVSARRHRRGATNQVTRDVYGMSHDMTQEASHIFFAFGKRLKTHKKKPPRRAALLG